MDADRCTLEVLTGLVPGDTYTALMRVTRDLDAPVVALSAGGTLGESSRSSGAPEVLRVVFTATESVDLALVALGSETGAVYADELLVTDGDYAGDYFDGTFPSRPGYVEWPLGVFLLATPERVLDEFGQVTREVDAYDQLLVLQQDRTIDRLSIPAGTLYTDAIAGLVTEFATAIVPSALALPTALEWEPGESRLRILNDLLGAINYESAAFDERGVLTCQPYQSPAVRAPQHVYATDEASVITGSPSQVVDLFDVPNRWVLVKSEADQAPLVAVYTNASSASPTSTVSRGRVITELVTESDAPDLATLEEKAARLAFEASQVYEVVTFSTLIMPTHGNADVLDLELEGLGIGARYSEHSWGFDLVAGATMAHKARRVVNV